MTPKQWIDQANQNREKLISFVEVWHPARNQANVDVFNDPAMAHLPITAPGPEQARQVVCTFIQKQQQGTDPGWRFKEALRHGEADNAYSLLNSAWFGVPESTGCWGIEGFSEAVDLLEDPPEEEMGPETVNVLENKGG